MSDNIDQHHSEQINRKAIQNKLFLLKVIKNEIKEDCSLKQYFINGVKNNNFYIMMCIRNFIIEKKYV